MIETVKVVSLRPFVVENISGEKHALAKEATHQMRVGMVLLLWASNKT